MWLCVVSWFFSLQGARRDELSMISIARLPCICGNNGWFEMLHPPTDVTGARSKSELASDIWLLDEADFTSFLPHIHRLSRARPVSRRMTNTTPGAVRMIKLREVFFFFFFSSKVKPRKVGAIMRVVKPVRWSAGSGGKARVPLGAWWAASPWPLKRLPWHCKEQRVDEQIGQVAHYQCCRGASKASLIIWWWITLIGPL